MSELRWWLLGDTSGIRTSRDGTRFDIYERKDANGKIVAMCVYEGNYGPYRAFDTVFEAMKWAEETFEALSNPIHEDEER